MMRLFMAADVRARVAFVLALPALVGGCVTHRAGGLNERFVKPGKPAVSIAEGRPADGTTVASRADAARALAASVRPPREAVRSIEEREPDLAEARRRWREAETAATARHVADAYRRLQVLDAAHEYYSRAVALDRTDAASYDALARIWRDWGMADLGLGDAHRAVYYAPGSAAAHNTLGTLLAARRRWSDARAEFGRALALDPSAAYAAHNLLAVDRAEADERAAHDLR